MKLCYSGVGDDLKCVYASGRWFVALADRVLVQCPIYSVAPLLGC
jgi:hypothetical protein